MGKDTANGSRLVILQGTLAALTLAGLLLVPPASGRMMVVPLSDAAARRQFPVTLAAGALVVGRGPWRGSVVVSGERARLLHSALASGNLLLAAPPVGCGK